MEEAENRVRIVTPNFVGRRTRLRPVTGQDLPFLYTLETHGDILPRWRFAGSPIPPPEVFAAKLWEGVLAQFVIERLSPGNPIGHVCAYNPRLIHGTAHLAVVITPELQGRGWALEGAGLFVDFLFRNFPLRKLYAETVEYNYGASFSRGLGRFFSEEGRLREHSYYDGRYWDTLILTIDRDTWISTARPFFDRIARFKAEREGRIEVSREREPSARPGVMRDL
jgi:RimJ/RimL family protein N-acetyltransferase